MRQITLQIPSVYDIINIDMLIKLFPKLGDNFIIKYIKRGLESRYSAILIAALTLLSNLFSWEFPVFYTFTVIIAFAALFCDDMLCLLPMACCSYFTFSKTNNPLSSSHTSVFLEKSTRNSFWVIVAVVAVFVIGRLVFDLVTNKERRRFPKLTWGFVALGLAFVLGGLFSPLYGVKTAFFGLTEILAMSFSYFYFYFTVDFKKVDKSYFAYLMIVVGFLLCGEVVGMLYYGGFFSAEGEFSRSKLYTGWGMYNNVAGALIMCLPAPFYYATTKKHGWAYLLLGNVFLVALFFAQSRGGIIFGTALYALCLFVMLWKTSKRLPLIVAEMAVLTVVGLICLFFKEQLWNMFYSVIQRGLDDSNRFNIYISGLKQFLDYPVFGNGFYACENFRWGDKDIGGFLPPRYHNTYVQLLASGGAVAFIAYIFHRYQTISMVFKKRNVEKYFIGMCILGLLLTSILDCHFFNFGPGFTYSALLLLLEIDWTRTPDEKK